MRELLINTRLFSKMGTAVGCEIALALCRAGDVATVGIMGDHLNGLMTLAASIGNRCQIESGATVIRRGKWSNPILCGCSAASS